MGDQNRKISSVRSVQIPFSNSIVDSATASACMYKIGFVKVKYGVWTCLINDLLLALLKFKLSI